MSSFSVSLKDSLNRVGISANTSTISVIDYSNYSTNTESGHAQASFSVYRKLKITLPDGTNYLFSSVGDGDAITVVPSSSSLPITDNYTNTAGDGIYTATLYCVPTWSASGVYTVANQVHVYYNSKIYKLLVNSTNNQPDISTTQWVEVTDLNLLPTKYRAEEKFAVTCGIKLCHAQKVAEALCSECYTVCNPLDFCSNVSIFNFIKLGTILEAIPLLVDQQDWANAQNAINRGKLICCCNS